MTDLLIANVVPKQFPKGNFIRGATSDIKQCITSKNKTMKRSFVLARNIDAVIRNMIAANQWNNTSYEVTLNQSVTHLLNDPYLTPDIDLLEIKDLFNKHLLKIIANPDIWIKRMNEYYTINCSLSLKEIEKQEQIVLKSRLYLSHIFTSIYHQI